MDRRIYHCTAQETYSVFLFCKARLRVLVFYPRAKKNARRHEQYCMAYARKRIPSKGGDGRQVSARLGLLPRQLRPVPKVEKKLCVRQSDFSGQAVQHFVKELLEPLWSLGRWRICWRGDAGGKPRGRVNPTGWAHCVLICSRPQGIPPTHVIGPTTQESTHVCGHGETGNTQPLDGKGGFGMFARRI